jgi:transcriptional regulator with GAF, ATPase, and Fis domain
MTAGRVATWLRDRWVLAVIICVAAVAVGVLPRVAVDAAGKMHPWALTLVTVSAVIAAAAVLLDRVADWHSKQVDAQAEQGRKRATENMLNDLLNLLDEAADLSFASGAARDARLHVLEVHAASVAASVAVSNVRATYYQVEPDEDGWRSITKPKSRGRSGDSHTTFIEKDEQDHPIWAALGGRDTDCKIYNAPDPTPRVDWQSRDYKTFISVPVKVEGVVFGMLTVNAPRVGDLTELDRLTTVTIARLLAVIHAVNYGPRNLRDVRESIDPKDYDANEKGDSDD